MVVNGLLIGLPALIVICSFWLGGAMPRNGRRAEALIIFFVIQTVAYGWLLFVELVGHYPDLAVLREPPVRALGFRILQASAFLYLSIVFILRVNKPMGGG